MWNAVRYFGPTVARFDHHGWDAIGNVCEEERGILFLARNIPLLWRRCSKKGGRLIA